MKKRSLLVIVCLAFCIFCAGSAWGEGLPLTEVCVSDATALQTALTAAETNGTDNVIKVVQGTYVGNFTYSSTGSNSLDLLGGYTAGCASRVLNPANTILDGNDTGVVLLIDFAGDKYVAVEGFTIQRGSTADGRGGGIFIGNYSSVSTSQITIKNNIIKDNTAVYDGGGIAAQASGAEGGNIDIINNIITGNTTGGELGGGVFALSWTTSEGTLGTVNFINNTVTGNTVGNHGGGAYLYSNSTEGVVNVYNNIIRGNTPQDIYQGAPTTNGYNNNYTSINAGWTNAGDNIDVDPQFIGSGNYHLRSTSPCIDAGANGAPGILTTDVDGDSRTLDGNHDGTATADMGADEYYPALYSYFSGYGVYKYDDSSWSKLSTLVPSLMTSSSSDLYSYFSGYGVYKYNGTWSRITTLVPTLMTSSYTQLYTYFSGYGVYKYDGGAWSRLTTLSPSLMAASGTDLYVYFSGYGVYKYDGTTWNRIHTLVPSMLAATATGLYAYFEGNGVYKYNGTTWSKISNMTPLQMAASGTDLYACFDSYGVYKYNGTWSKISTLVSSSLSASSTDLYAYFDTYGVYKYDGTTWSRITTLVPSLMTGTR